MITLGIHDGHTATACIMKDGVIVAALSEERLTRKKEQAGFPELAIKECMKLAGCTPQDIHAVGICSLFPQIGTQSYYHPAWYKRVFGILTRIVPSYLLQRNTNSMMAQWVGQFLFHKRKRIMIHALAQLGIMTQKIHFFEHHALHAATTYYMSGFHHDKTLVLTLDGSGDGVCATVNVASRHEGILRRKSIFNYNSVCDFYTRVTQYLGMKPMSHEYKVMGLAPYADEKRSKKVAELFHTWFSVTGMDITNTSGVWKWQFQRLLEKKLHGVRFDVVAGGAQRFFEETILEWVKNAIKETGIQILALGGGGFMNVKLNYLISQLPEVKSVFIFPSCGDESNPMGAALCAAIKEGYERDAIRPLRDIYWGASFTNSDIKKALDEYREALRHCTIMKCDNSNEVIAHKLAEGKIVGRFQGRMEWGARALGNRSILADARRPEIIHRINKAIKMRDFWMPFAPSIVDQRLKDYVAEPGTCSAPFMTIAAPSLPSAEREIAAGLHPFDKTTRYQIVTKTINPSYYELLTYFAKETGCGGILNTSFNIHGDPIVMTPQDAIETFLSSGLDVLQLEQYVIEKL